MQRQLDQIGDAPLVDIDDPSFVEIHDKATKWVMDLFENSPDRVPPTLAFKLFLDGTKMRNAQEVPENVEEVPHSLLDKIHALPVPHAVSLLETEIGRLAADLAAHQAALADLKGLL